MKRFIILFFTSIVFLQTPLRADTISYSIQAGVKVGDAQLRLVGPTVYKGQQTLLITFKAKGFNFVDEENIYLNSLTYKPLFVERTYNNEKISEEYINDGRQINVTKTVNGKITKQVIEKAMPADNIYGFIYRYRKEGSFKIGEVLELNLPTNDLKIKLVKRMQLKVIDQQYNAFYMQSNPSKYKIWFDASDKKIPLRINGGLGTMVMTKYEN
ncbi:MAG: hypothetical protein WCH62_00140 [Candidatus Omnitrophota bacterium]